MDNGQHDIGIKEPHLPRRIIPPYRNDSRLNFLTNAGCNLKMWHKCKGMFYTLTQFKNKKCEYEYENALFPNYNHFTFLNFNHCFNTMVECVTPSMAREGCAAKAMWHSQTFRQYTSV
jgi:hypothetical protein